jgi:hypothetical protein
MLMVMRFSNDEDMTMAETRIPNSDGYPISVQVGPPLVAEDPKRWHPPSLSEAAVCKRYRVNPETILEVWPTVLGFPRPARNSVVTSAGSFALTRRREWDVDKLETWEASIRAAAARLPTKG